MHTNNAMSLRIGIDATTARVPVHCTDSLGDLYTQIGCTTVERIVLPGGMEIWLDEEGFYRSEPNALASLLVGALLDAPCALYGNAVLTGPGAADGLPAADLNRIELVLAAITTAVAAATGA